jgi:hypothetical protein
MRDTRLEEAKLFVNDRVQNDLVSTELEQDNFESSKLLNKNVEANKPELKNVKLESNTLLQDKNLEKHERRVREYHVKDADLLGLGFNAVDLPLLKLVVKKAVMGEIPANGVYSDEHKTIVTEDSRSIVTAEAFYKLANKFASVHELKETMYENE